MAKKQPPSGPVTGRVLYELTLDGHTYKPNDVVTLPPELGAQQLEMGSIDDDPGAVAYCTDELKAQPVDHAARVAAAAAASEAPQA